MTFTQQEYLAMVSHYVALARIQASSQMRWHYMAEARRNKTQANNIAFRMRMSK